jgi:acyl carrier protein
MTMDKILEQVNEVFVDVLENPAIALRRETVAGDVPEWDSLNHVMLVVAIEKRFNIRFAAGEIHSFRNVGEMCDAIAKKL